MAPCWVVVRLSVVGVVGGAHHCCWLALLAAITHGHHCCIWARLVGWPGWLSALVDMDASQPSSPMVGVRAVRCCLIMGLQIADIWSPFETKKVQKHGLLLLQQQQKNKECSLTEAALTETGVTKMDFQRNPCVCLFLNTYVRVVCVWVFLEEGVEKLRLH